MPTLCQALSLSSDAAQRLADKLASTDDLHPITRATAGLYLLTLAQTLERIELEQAGQLAFFQEAFQAELFGPGPSVAREEADSSASVRAA